MKRIGLLLCLLLPLGAAMAVQVKGLYHIELPVVTQSSEERSEVAKEGLAYVLMRLTGDADIQKNATIKSALNKSAYFIQEFRYAAYNQPQFDAHINANALQASQYFIHIHYNKTDVDRLLNKAGVQVWGSARPLVIVWATYRGRGHNVQILSSESPGRLLTMMRRRAKYYGVPMMFPMMDMADVTLVSPVDVRNMSLSVLKEASKRYNPDAYLIGSVSEGDRETRSEWQLVVGDRRWGWSLNDKTTEHVVDAVLKETAHTLSQAQVTRSVAVLSAQWIKVEVQHIRDGEDMALLTQALRRVSSVKDVQLLQVTGENVELSLQIQGTLDAFQKEAADGMRLLFKPDLSVGDKLVFEWAQQGAEIKRV